MSHTPDTTSDSLIPNGNDASAAAEPATPPNANDEPVVEHDVLRESSPVNNEGTDFTMADASVVPQVDSVPDPSDIPADPPNGSPPPAPGILPDAQLAEDIPPTNGVNGVNGNDVDMDEPEAHSPPATPGIALTTPEASTSYLSPKVEVDEDGPPAKRARVHSDADRASLANSATPPPASADSRMTMMPPPTPSTSLHPMTSTQYRFLVNSVKSLKKQKDAGPFLKPVDPVGLNIPHYPSIITHPMDFGTIERKVVASNPSKPDSNTSNPRYNSLDEFVSDVRLIFHNCYTFNGPEHAISVMAKRLEEVFERQIKNMPPATDTPVVKKATPPPPPPPPAAVKKPPAGRRVSTAGHGPVAQAVRPKRETHPPVPKDIPYPDGKKNRKAKQVDTLTVKQLQYCGKILQEIFKKHNADIASPFYEPVDWVKMEIPSYPKIVKKPMDLSTIRRKLENGDYPNAQKFADDFKLMIRNCFAFNPSGTPVCTAGIELQRLFDNKWKLLPDAREDSEDEDDLDSEDDHNRAIQELEGQMKTISETLASLKQAKAAMEKKKKAERLAKQQQAAAAAAAQASSSKPTKAPRPPKKSGGSKPSKKAAAAADDDGALSFSQKKDLSEAIQNLDGVKLEKVIKIIHEGFPEIRDSTEEIEIEIDRLPGPVLTKLYNFVIRPQRPVPGKRSRHGKGTGTGGLKRKSMDEDVEAEKIRQLEQRMQMFDQAANGGTMPLMPAGAGSESDSSSGSDSSASDSE